MLLDLEGSAAVVSAYNEQNNKLFLVHIYHSETAEIQIYTNRGCLLLSKENLSNFRKGTLRTENLNVTKTSQSHPQESIYFPMLGCKPAC